MGCNSVCSLTPPRKSSRPQPSHSWDAARHFTSVCISTILDCIGIQELTPINVDRCISAIGNQGETGSQVRTKQLEIPRVQRYESFRTPPLSHTSSQKIAPIPISHVCNRIGKEDRESPRLCNRDSEMTLLRREWKLAFHSILNVCFKTTWDPLYEYHDSSIADSHTRFPASCTIGRSDPVSTDQNLVWERPNLLNHPVELIACHVFKGKRDQDHDEEESVSNLMQWRIF